MPKKRASPIHRKGVNMSVLGTINERRHKFGMPVKELSRRTGIDYERLRCALLGYRKLTAGEFVEVCGALGLTLEDFTTEDLNKLGGSNE